MRLEKPHSLSYHDHHLGLPPHDHGESGVEHGTSAGCPRCRTTTIGSSVYCRMPGQRPFGRHLHGRVDLLDRGFPLQGHDQVDHRSVGHRARAWRYPSSLPLSSGSTRPMARAAPVDVGMIDMDGGPGPAQVIVGQVEDALVVGVGVHGGHETLLDAEGVEQHLCRPAPGSWWCTRRSRGCGGGPGRSRRR